jgi:bifunctional non-homologous end joining protein LigD
MLARLVTEVMDNPDWLYETKLDGYRMLFAMKDGEPYLISRRGNSYLQTYRLLLDDLGKIEENVILDGEVVVENQKGISDFQLLQNYGTTRKGNLKYYVFDILYLSGHKLMDFPLLKRKELLDSFFSKYDFERVFKLDYQTGNGKQLFEKLSGLGYEGIIAKDPDSIYDSGRRSASWLKIKSTTMQEAIICGYTEPRGGRKHFGSIILGLYDRGILKYIGNCGTGFNEASLKELMGKFRHLESKVCPFPQIPKLSWSKGSPSWLRPELVANIKFLEWSKDGIMRAPVFMGLRDDKLAPEVVNESQQAEGENAGKSKKKSKVNEKSVTVSGKAIMLTNLTKVYWPAEGYTKGDLIEYYRTISNYILPYLKNRPQSLNRHPDGIKGPNFYQKDMDTGQTPDWALTVKLDSKIKAGGIDYLVCNDTATLLYMANLGCIEINPWHSTYMKPENPDYLIIDLDPGNISFVDVVNTALVVKEICDEIDITCYCKTSGSTGLHVYIPLGAKYDYDQARTFAEILAGIAHRRLPSTTSIERSVSKRKDKIYIDFLQNRKAQTVAAPYSVRPRPFATVSTPLHWNEVNHQLTPEMFTIRNLAARLEKAGDLWRPVLGKGISLPKALKTIERLG